MGRRGEERRFYPVKRRVAASCPAPRRAPPAARSWVYKAAATPIRPVSHRKMAIIHLLGWAWPWACEVLRPHTTLVLVFVTVVLVSRYTLHPRGCPLPPGPWGLPLLGYLPFLSGDTKNSLLALARRFGPIYRLRFGTKGFVVLADPEVIREAFRREEFNVRPNGALYDIFDGYGECWTPDGAAEGLGLKCSGGLE